MTPVAFWNYCGKFDTFRLGRLTEHPGCYRFATTCELFKSQS